MKYKWKIENRYDNNEHGLSVSKSNFRNHREAVNDLIKEIKNKNNQLKYSFGEKDRTKTIITVEAYIEELEND